MAVLYDQMARCGFGCRNSISAGCIAPLAIALLLVLMFAPLSLHAQARIQLPRTGLTPDDLGVIVNDSDPLSRQIADYYQKARGIPSENMIHLRFPVGRDALSRDEFQQLKAEIDQAAPAHIQAYAVAWTTPYRVDCMSLTSALAFGFDERYCSSSCGPTQPSPYFNSPSQHPASDHKLRPSMMLAGVDFQQVKSLIDRGVAADHSFPPGVLTWSLPPTRRVASARSISNLPQKNWTVFFPSKLSRVKPLQIVMIFSSTSPGRSMCRNSIRWSSCRERWRII